MSWFSKFFEVDEWRMCGTVEMPIIKTDIRQDISKGTLYYYLYENQHGERKFDIADTFRGDIDLAEVDKADIVYRSHEYLATVKPWLAGRKMTGIVAYDKVHHHDFAKLLKKGE